MRKIPSITLCFWATIILFSSCTTHKQEAKIETIKAYKPDSQELYNAIVQQDSIFFAAYNVCDLDKQASTYSDSIEFYHDQGGLMTSKQAIIDATKKIFVARLLGN